MDDDKQITNTNPVDDDNDRVYKELLVKEMMKKLSYKIEQNDPILLNAIKTMINDDKIPNPDKTTKKK